MNLNQNCGNIFFMNWIDIVVVIIITISGVFAFFKGFIREALSILGLIIATILSFRFYRHFSVYLKSIIAAKPLREFVAFIIIFLVLLGIVAVITYLAKIIFKKAGLNFYDRLLGLIFGIIRGLIIAYIFIIIVETTKIAPKDLKRSKTYEVVKSSVTLLTEKGKNIYKRIKR